LCIMQCVATSCILVFVSSIAQSPAQAGCSLYIASVVWRCRECAWEWPVCVCSALCACAASGLTGCFESAACTQARRGVQDKLCGCAPTCARQDRRAVWRSTYREELLNRGVWCNTFCLRLVRLQGEQQSVQHCRACVCARMYVRSCVVDVREPFTVYCLWPVPLLSKQRACCVQGSDGCVCVQTCVQLAEWTGVRLY
jgi:hypothetical protein